MCSDHERVLDRQIPRWTVDLTKGMTSPELFNVLVSFSYGTLCWAISNKITNKRQQQYYFFWFVHTFYNKSHASALGSSPSSTERVLLELKDWCTEHSAEVSKTRPCRDCS